MKINSGNPGYHISYWIIVVVVISLFFGRQWENNLAAFYFVTMLLPVVLGTSYFFNYFLVPRFFMKRKVFKFILYTFYLIVISLYLETMVLLFSFIYFTNYSLHGMGPNANAIVMLGLVMYLLVFVGSFLLLAQQIKEKQKLINELVTEKEKMEMKFLEVMSRRKKVRIAFEDIIYIESLADYIKIHCNGNQVMSKEKISNIETRLPDMFVRIHRSFIVNKSKVTTLSSGQVHLNEVVLNIGRSYRNKAKAMILSNG